MNVRFVRIAVIWVLVLSTIWLGDRLYRGYAYVSDEPRLVAMEGKLSDWEKVGSSRVDLQACKLEYSIVSPK